MLVRIRALLLRAAVLGLAALAMLAASGKAMASGLTYYGGPVAHSMNVVLVEWGSGVRSTYTDATAGDPAFLRYLASQSGSTSDIGAVLAQYMDTTGSNSKNTLSYDAAVQITPSVGAVPPATVQDSDIQTELASDIGSGALPAPAGDGLSTIYVVLFPPNDDVCLNGGCAYDASGFCAYHGSFPLSGSSAHVLYAAMVDDGPGTPNYGYCGPSSDDFANHTDTLSHELAETINDPLVAEAPAYAPPLGWYNQTLGEIGDICVGSGEQAQNGPWTVQKIWSNLDNGCVASESAYSAPTASFLAASTAAAGQQVGFDASSSRDPAANTASASYSGASYSITSGIASYKWNWGDGTTTAASSSASATHSFASPGNYQVSLTVVDQLGFESTVTHEISITAPTTTTPPALTTGAATAVDDQGATLAGTINPEDQSVSYQFIYGTSPTTLDQATPLMDGPTGTTATAVSATLSGLSPSTTYFYELKVVAGGQTYLGSPPQNFTTNVAPPPPQTPVATTGSASQVSAGGAQLTGTVNPGGFSSVSYQFSYGTSATNLDQTTPAITVAGGTTAVPESADVEALSPATTYYFRLDVTLAGATYSGTVQSLSTAAPAPAASTGHASAITSSGATVSGTVNPNGIPATYQVQFGTTTAYGYSTVASSAGAGDAGGAVSVTLTGLKPNTLYHFRLVASSAGGTSVGADSSFKTLAPPKPAPKLWLGVNRRLSLRKALRHGVRVRFGCGEPCHVHFEAMALPPKRAARFGRIPVTVARLQAHTSSGKASTITISFTRRVRRRLLRPRSLVLLITGYAVSGTSAQSQPVRVQLTLH